MASAYESVCEELDDLALTYLTKLNEYTHQWKTTSNEFQQGFLNLAHAKYTMGARTVSHYSYDERMKALLQVDIDDADTITAKAVAPVPPASPEKESTTLRKRHEPVKKKNSEWVEVESTEKEDAIELDEKKNKKKIKKSGDPLYWFGLFVSPSLRTSQEHFKSAADQIIHQVNRISDLKAIERRYYELQEEKLALKLKQTSIQEDVTA